jgi:hypothetical protein
MTKAMKKKGISKIGVVYIAFQVISTGMYILHLCKDKFGCKNETRRIGEFDVTLNNEKFEGENGIVAETISNNDGDRSINVRTDMYFRIMPKDVQDCVLAHECGHHLYSKPVIVPVWCTWNTTERDVEDEHMADMYSVQLYGKKATIKMLRYLYVLTIFNSEVLARIKLVKKAS